MRGSGALPALLERWSIPAVVAQPGGRARLNQAARRLFALPAATEASRLPVPWLLTRALEGESTSGARFEWRRGDEIIVLRAAIAPAVDGTRIVGAIGIFEEVSPSSDDARARDRVSRLTHDLRAPLGPILGWARTLHRRYPDDANIRRAVEVIERNVALALRCLEDLEA